MDSNTPVRVLLTGAAGQIAYSLIPIICRGDVFGANQPIVLNLLDIPVMEKVLEGVLMEVQDCAYPLVREVNIYVEEKPAFTDIDAAFLVGSMPRRQGMERKDLLAANVKIFASQGKALKQFSKPTCKVLVVGNPANTNALICAKFASPTIPYENITAMTRLDENRLKAIIARKNNVAVDSVENAIIWGNHSSTQFPDVSNVLINGQSLKFDNHDPEVIKIVQTRGAAIIEARKLSSAMSAAKAAADHMRDFVYGSNGKQVCMGVYTGSSDSEGVNTDNRALALQYGAADNLIFSLPVVICNKTKQWRVVSGLSHNNFAKEKIAITLNELIQERDDALSAVSTSNL